MEKKLLEELKGLDLRALRNRGMKVVAQMEDFRNKRDGNGELTKDQEEQWDKWDNECVEIEKEIRHKELEEKFSAEELRGGKGRPVAGGVADTTDEKFDPNFKPSEKRVSETMQKLKRHEGELKWLNDEERKIVSMTQFEEDAFLTLFRAGFNINKIDEETRMIINAHEKRAQSTTTTAGGFTIPQGFIPTIIQYFKYISPFFAEMEYPNVSGGVLDNVFQVYRTEAGNDLPVATNDDTGSIGELISENGDISSSSGDATFAQKTLKAYKYSSKMIKVSNELLQDTGVDLVGYLARIAGTRLARILNSQFTNGTNSSQPEGVTKTISLGKLAGTTTVISFPEIIDLIHSVDPSYRAMPSCRFMMHDSILKAVKKLTVGASTTNARPLWAPGWDVSAPPTIDGFQYMINQDMDNSIAAGKKVMLFGDFKQYAVRWVNQLRIIRLQERYAEFDQVAFFALMRADGRWLNTSGVKYYAGT